MAMEVVSGASSAPSTLNPNAPMFVPSSYRSVEDFSDDWWSLVQSSPWFRDYWLRERYCDPQTDSSFLDFSDPALTDFDALFDDAEEFNSDVVSFGTDSSDSPKDVVRVGSAAWRKGRVSPQSPRFIEKAPKIIKVKMSPRTIQQPR